MNRLQFIRTAKNVLLSIPVFGSFGSDILNLINRGNFAEPHLCFFPDKDNYLTAATCVFATPAAGDGKNGDDSLVDVIVDVECYDNLYTARGSFINNTEIESNVVRDMGIGFSDKDARSIFFDGVNNVGVIILGNKPNQDDAHNDKWNVRWELFLQFKKGNILSTSGSDPQVEYHFSVGQTRINEKSFFKRSELVNKRGMKPGDHIG